MKHVDIKELEKIAAPVKMDREAKLKHWAKLVRSYKGTEVMIIFHNLERWTTDELLKKPSGVYPRGYTDAFSIAFADKTLQAQGIKEQDQSFRGAMNFFELTQAQLHEFACDCGGSITTNDMADRIERLATNGPGRGAGAGGSFMNRMFRS